MHTHEHTRTHTHTAIKWRQISEPNDPVFWIDLLAPEVRIFTRFTGTKVQILTQKA